MIATEKQLPPAWLAVPHSLDTLQCADITKQYVVKSSGTEMLVVLKTTAYSRGEVARIAAIFNEARKDFPCLDPNNAQVESYSGRPAGGVTRLFFTLPICALPREYQVCSNEEMTRY